MSFLLTSINIYAHSYVVTNLGIILPLGTARQKLIEGLLPQIYLAVVIGFT